MLAALLQALQGKQGGNLPPSQPMGSALMEPSSPAMATGGNQGFTAPSGDTAGGAGDGSGSSVLDLLLGKGDPTQEHFDAAKTYHQLESKKIAAQKAANDYNLAAIDVHGPRAPSGRGSLLSELLTGAVALAAQKGEPGGGDKMMGAFHNVIQNDQAAKYQNQAEDASRTAAKNKMLGAQSGQEAQSIEGQQGQILSAVNAKQQAKDAADQQQEQNDLRIKLADMAEKTRLAIESGKVNSKGVEALYKTATAGDTKEERRGAKSNWNVLMDNGVFQDPRGKFDLTNPEPDTPKDIAGQLKKKQMERIDPEIAKMKAQTSLIMVQGLLAEAKIGLTKQQTAKEAEKVKEMPQELAIKVARANIYARNIESMMTARKASTAQRGVQLQIAAGNLSVAQRKVYHESIKEGIAALTKQGGSIKGQIAGLQYNINAATDADAKKTMQDEVSRLQKQLDAKGADSIAGQMNDLLQKEKVLGEAANKDTGTIPPLGISGDITTQPNPLHGKIGR